MVDASSLAEFRWQNRLIVAFMKTDSQDHRWLVQWTQHNHCRLSERDLIVFVVTGTSVEQLSPPLTSVLEEKKPGGSSDLRHIEALESAAVTFLIQQRQFASAATEVLLIGKDGGIKSQSQNIKQIDEWFNLIDAMPMRRQEAGKQSDVC